MKKLEKFTAGKTPAALYLVEFLNTEGTFKDRNVLKFIASFRKSFNQLAKAAELGIIDSKTLGNYCSMKREGLNAECLNYMSNGLSPLVVNLYRNLVLAEIKSYTRKATDYARAISSGIDRAKFNKTDSTLLKTYGVVDGVEYPFVVYFNNAIVQHNLNVMSIKDSVTAESLTEKSKVKLAKYNKVSTLY